MTPPLPPIDAYLETEFIAFELDRELSIRIGEHSPEFDELLARHGVASGLFITGWNPFSQEQHPEINATANARMTALFVRRGLTMLHHIGRSPDGTWIEEGFFVPGLGPSEGLLVAAEFNQHAIVVVEIGGSAKLHLTDNLVW